MDKTPVVSIVIPTYNHASFLEKCLQSLLYQTFTDWEAVVVNNFSDDNTIDVVNAFRDLRIRLVNFKNNGIIAASRNEGIRLSNADLIAFLDSDDIWYPEKLYRCIEELTQDRDLVCHNMRFVRNGKRWKDVKCGPAKRATFHHLLYNRNCLITSAVMVRKGFLMRVNGFSEDPNIVTAEDYDLWLKLSKGKARLHFINEILGEYTVHETNASGTALRHMRATWTVCEKYFASTGKANIWKRLNLRRRKALLFYGAARSYQRSEQRTEALRFFAKSFVIFPFIARVYVAMLYSLFRVDSLFHVNKAASTR